MVFVTRAESIHVVYPDNMQLTRHRFYLSRGTMAIGFGGFLERLRTEKGLSLRQLGQLADIDHAYVHRLETGEKVGPSDDIVNGLIRALRPGERKGRILKFLVGQSVEEDLLDEVLEDADIPIDDFESAAQMRSRGRPEGREAWRRILKQIRQIREKMEGG
jgi:transcriptional regulator with XRE-family HTH domain